MNELTYQEIEILAVLAINAVETRSFGNGVDMHPTLIERLSSAHSKLIAKLSEVDGRTV